MSNQNEILHAKFETWIDILDVQIIELYDERTMFNEFKKIVRNNPLLAQDNSFLYSIAIWYSAYTSITIRKLADKDNDTISYRRLLDSIKKNPKVISRKNFLTKFVDTSYTQYLANTDFDSYAGVGNEYLDLAVIDKEIAELESKTIKLKKYVNERIAHHSKNEFKDIPSFAELNEAIDFLGNLHRRYYAIIKCSSTSLGSVWQYDWKEIFNHSWIPR